MRANVRCVGRPVAITDREAPTEYDMEPSCGWTGERFAMGKLTPNQERELRPLSPDWFRACVDADRVAQTSKPCPSCGGRVELIPVDGAA